ncbi:MAG TPA: hypothetical protein VG889_12710 [Rhizomicrobium sp.]|nr:hypothetical protein [Rhizomicrobium sp.]
MIGEIWNSISWFLGNVLRFQALFGVFILVFFLFATHLLQRRALDRVKDVMLCCAPQLRSTRAYKEAVRYFDRRNPGKLTDAVKDEHEKLAQGKSRRDASPADPTESDTEVERSRWLLHFLPPFVLLLVTFSLSLVTFFGAEYSAVNGVASFVLGGKLALVPHHYAEMQAYQSATLFMVSVTFLVSYVRTIARLVERINNNDIRPVSYYFLALDMLTAILVAIVTRHVAAVFDALGGNKTPPELLALIAFAIGWNPRLWLDDLWKKASQKLKMDIVEARAPKPANLPLNMSLAMVQGLTGDYADRLHELGVDNCQDLAERNAIVLWLRTPFTLELICDWISQAQLCRLYDDDRLQLLRKAGIRDICCYARVLENGDGVAAVLNVLGGSDMQPALLIEQKKAIEDHPGYMQLRELHKAMQPDPEEDARAAAEEEEEKAATPDVPHD